MRSTGSPPGGEHQNGNLALFAYAAQDLDAAHAGHHHVEHHDVEVLLVEQLKRLRAAVRGGGRKAFELQVIDEQSD
jgi:hypothetical protein